MSNYTRRLDVPGMSFVSHPMRGGGGKLLALACAALGLLAPCATARAATWSDDATASQRVLTLASGETYSLTDADVSALVSSGTDFAVRGSGTAVCAVDMASFAKDAVIGSGVSFSMETTNCFGTAAGAVTVQDGGALCFNNNNREARGMLKNKKVYFEGDGPDGNGAIQCIKGEWWSILSDSPCEFYLTGDAKTCHKNRLNYTKFLDTCGHDLEIVCNWYVCGGSYFTNSAARASTVKVTNGLLLVHEWADGDPFCGSADNVIVLSGGSYSTSGWNVANSWTLAFEGYAYADAQKWVADGASAPLTACNFSGPLDVRGTQRFTTRTNAAMTVSGPLSGAGSITVDGGWLNLASTNVTFTGPLAVQAKAVHEPSWRAGLGLRANTALPLQKLSFSDADLLMDGAFASALPPLSFAGGAGATNRVTGGGLLNRLSCPSLAVADGATAEVLSPVTVADAAVGAGATLRVGMTTVGNAGLMGRAEYPTSGVWAFPKPTEEEIATTYTNRYLTGFPPNEVMMAQGFRNFRFRGYLWNREATNATWSFLVNWSVRVWLFLDGNPVFSNVGGYQIAQDRVATVTDVAPGPHEIILFLTAANTTDKGPQKLGDVYCAMGFDSQGRGMIDAATDKYSGEANKIFAQYYVPLVDPGDGSLLTVDTATAADPALYLPSFTNLAFGAGATFDGGGQPLAVATLSGCPTVTDVPTLTIREAFTVNVADFVTGGSRPCAVDGAVIFGADAVVDVTLPTGGLTTAQKRAFRGGATVLSADSISGTPRLSEAAKAAGFRLEQQGGDLVLSYGRGTVFIIR